MAYGCLATHDLGGGVTTTTEAAIAEACGVSPRTVRRRLRDLALRGLVVVAASRVPRQGHARAHRGANAYVVRDPAMPYQPPHRPEAESALQALGQRVGATYSIRALTGQEDNGFVRPISGSGSGSGEKKDKQWGGQDVRPMGDQGNRDGDAAIAIAGEGTGATAPGAETGELTQAMSLAEYASQCCREEMGCDLPPYLLGPWHLCLTREAIAAAAARCGARKRQGEAGVAIRLAYPRAYYLAALQAAAGVRPRRGRDATPTVVPLRRESAATPTARVAALAAAAPVDTSSTVPTVAEAALADLPVDLPAPAAVALVGPTVVVSPPAPMTEAPAAPAVEVPAPEAIAPPATLTIARVADRRAASAAVAEASPAQPWRHVGVCGVGPDASAVATVAVMGEALRREPAAVPDIPAERVEVPVPPAAEMLRQMVVIGVRAEVARGLVSRVAAEVARQLVWLPYRRHARNLAGMLIAAIIGQWEEPSGAREARLRAAEREVLVQAQEEQGQAREWAQSPEGRAAALAGLAACRAALGHAG